MWASSPSDLLEAGAPPRFVSRVYPESAALTLRRGLCVGVHLPSMTGWVVAHPNLPLGAWRRLIRLARSLDMEHVRAYMKDERLALALGGRPTGRHLYGIREWHFP